ncbi:MAG TPA: anti-sigma factor [Chloroflexota bacterium]|nr:anti-sigma factor [Chloroflexota bacterium]
MFVRTGRPASGKMDPRGGRHNRRRLRSDTRNREENSMRKLVLRRLDLALMIGLLAVSAVGGPLPASADMMGTFNAPLTGQGMYSGRDLSGSALGSLAEGVVLVQVLGLPATEGDKAYVGWLVDPDMGQKLNTGALKPVGAAGAYTGVYTAGKALSGFKMFALTIEPGMNMSNEPAGEIVLAGPL